MTDLSRKLRELAEQIEAPVIVPMGEMTVPRAVAMLRDLYGPSRYFSVDLDVNCHPNSPPRVVWTVYHEKGCKQFTASSLDVAVTMATDAESDTSDLDAIQAVLVNEPATQMDVTEEFIQKMAIAEEFGQGMSAPVKDPPF